MDEFIRKVYERGKVTIPKELRDLYGVKDGDMVKLRIVKVVQALDGSRREKEIDVDVRIGDDESVEVG